MGVGWQVVATRPRGFGGDTACLETGSWTSNARVRAAAGGSSTRAQVCAAHGPQYDARAVPPRDMRLSVDRTVVLCSYFCLFVGCRFSIDY